MAHLLAIPGPSLSAQTRSNNIRRCFFQRSSFFIKKSSSQGLKMEGKGQSHPLPCIYMDVQ